MPASRLLALLGGLLASASLPARAGETVAVLGVDTVEAPESAGSALSDALRDKLGSVSGVLVAPKRDYTEIKMLFCADAPSLPVCLVGVARSMKADLAIYGTIVGKGGKQKLQVTLKLVDVGADKVLATVEDEAVIAEVPQQAGRWLAQLRPSWQPSQLYIVSQPVGAEVTLDGRAIGKTPVRIAVAPGSAYAVEVKKRGFVPSSRNATATVGETTEVAFELSPIEAGGPEPLPVTPEHPGRVLKIAGIALLAAAAVGGGIAIYSWRHYEDLRPAAQASLADVQRQNPDYAAQQESWFNSRGHGCDFPGSKPANGPVQAYLNQCNEGASFAGATTGLWVGVGVLAAAGAGALGYGIYKDRAAKRDQSAFAPRLKLLSPVVTTSGGGLQAAFEF